MAYDTNPDDKKDETPINCGPVRKLATGLEIGSTGLHQYSGYVREEFLRQLQGTRKFRVYREMMDNDYVVGAILFAVDMLIRNVSWEIEPEDPDNQEDVDAAEFVDSARNDMASTWTETISEVLSMLPYGWSYHEVVFKVRRGKTRDQDTTSKFDDGKVGWAKLPIRGQTTLERWEFDENGNILGMWQRRLPSYAIVFIPIEKALLFRTKTHKNNPEGRSILRNAYRAWFFKKRIEEIEGIGVERDLAGLPVIYAPNKVLSPSAVGTEAQIQTQLKEIVTTVRRDEQEGVLMPGDRDENGERLYELTLLTTGGSRQFDTSKIIMRYNTGIAMSVLADFILLGHENVGSFALSSDKTNLFATALGAWLGVITDIFNRKAIPQLLEVNSMVGQVKLVHGDIEHVNLQELGEFVSKLSGAGAELFPDDDLENELRRIAGFPAKPVLDEDEVVQTPNRTQTTQPAAEDELDL